MNRMLLLILWAYLALVFWCRADLIFDVDFENPPHTNGMPVTIGSGSDRPSDAEDATVATGLADFSSQAARLDGGSLLFSGPQNFTTGVFSISWDYAMVSFDGPTFSIQSQVVGAGGIGVVFYLSFTQQSNVELTVNGLGPTNIASFVLGIHDYYNLLIDMDNRTFDISVNGIPRATGLEIVGEADLGYITIGSYQYYNPVHGVDNFQWSVIPEPSTFALIAMGTAFLLSRFGRRA